MCVYIYIYIYVRIHTSYICVCVCMYVYVYIYIYVYIDRSRRPLRVSGLRTVEDPGPRNPGTRLCLEEFAPSKIRVGSGRTPQNFGLSPREWGVHRVSAPDLLQCDIGPRILSAS